MKKAQITMETIFIYGIISLVVLSGIGALIYFGVLDLGSYLPDKCTLDSQDISCVEWSLVGDGATSSQLGLKANSQNVLISEITVTQSEGINVFEGNTPSCTITDGAIPPNPYNLGTSVDAILVTSDGLLGTPATNNCRIHSDYNGQKLKFDLSIKYKRAGGAIDQTASGTLVAKIR